MNVCVECINEIKRDKHIKSTSLSSFYVKWDDGLIESEASHNCELVHWIQGAQISSDFERHRNLETTRL